MTGTPHIPPPADEAEPTVFGPNGEYRLDHTHWYIPETGSALLRSAILRGRRSTGATRPLIEETPEPGLRVVIPQNPPVIPDVPRPQTYHPVTDPMPEIVPWPGAPRRRRRRWLHAMPLVMAILLAAILIKVTR